MGMKSYLVLACILGLLAGTASAQEPDLQLRPWGFGWDGNPTLRRQLGRWQLAVTAGPDDELRDEENYSFGPGLPDSLQGTLTDSSHRKNESGNVRLDILRQIDRQDNIVFFGQMGCLYQWCDGEYRTSYFYSHDLAYRETKESFFWDRWTLRLGGRVAWYPVPFVSLEADFGVAYKWYHQDKVRSVKDPDETEWDVDHTDTTSQNFDSFGFYDLTSGLNLVVWF